MIMAQVARAQAVIDLIVNDKGVAEQIKRTFEDAERKVAANGEVFQLKVDDSDFIDKFKKIKEISGNGNKIIIDFDDTSFKNAFGSASKEMQNSMTILRDFIVDIVKVFNGNGGFSNNFGEVRKLYDKIIKEEDKLAKIDRDNLKESFKSYKKNGSEENRNKFMAAYEEYFENTPSDDKNFKFTYNKKKYSFDDLKKEYNSLDDSFASLGVSGDVLDSIIDPIKESFRTAKRELENEIADLKNQAKNIINPVKTEENKTDGNGNGDYSNINIAPANLDEFYAKIEQHGAAKIAIKPANLEEFYDDIDEYQSKNGSAISKKDKSVYKDIVKLMKDYKDLNPEDLINEQRKLLNEAMKGTDTPLSNDQVKQLVALRELYKKKEVDSNAFKPSKYLLNAGRDDFDNIMPGYSDIKESFENTAKKYVNAGTIPVKVTPLNLNSFFDKLKTEADKKEIGINVTVDNVNTSNVSSNIAENTRELQEQEKLLKKISSLDDIIEKGDINVLDNFDENGKLTSKYINEKDLTSSKKTVTKKSIDKLIKSFNPESSSEEDIKKIASYLSAYKNPDNLKESSFKDNKGLWQRVNFILDNAKNSLNAYIEKEKLLKEHSEELNDIIENNKKQNINNANSANKQKHTPVIEQDTPPAPKEIEQSIEKNVIFKASFDETSIESLKGSANTLKQDIENLVSPIEVSFKESSVNNITSVIGEELSKLRIPNGNKTTTEKIETELPDNNSDLTSGLKDIETTISNVVNGIRNITQEYNTSVSSIQGGIEEQKKSIESIGDSVEKALKSIEPLNKRMEETASAYKKTIEEANQISDGLEKRIKAFEEYQKEKAKFEKEIQKSEEESDRKEGTTSNKSSKNREQKESYYDKTVKKIKDGFDKITFAKDNIYALDENSFEEMANGTVKFVAELKLANNEVERLVFNVGEADSILTKNGSIRKDFLKNSGVLEKQPEISIVNEQEENKIKETAIEIDGLENKVDELKKIASNTSGFNIIDEDKLKEDEDGFVRFSATVADTKGKLKELYFEVQDLTHIAKQDGGFTTTFKNSGLTKETIEKNKAKSDKKNLEISQKEALEQLKNASISSDFFNLKSSKFDNSGFLTFIGYLEDADGKVKELSYSAKELKDVLNSDGTLNENFIKEGNITKLEEILEKFKVQLAENKTNEALGVEDEEGIKNASKLEADFKTNVDSANLSLEKQQELLLKFSQIKASHVEKFDLEDKKNGSARNKANKTLTNYENILEHVGYTGNEETNYENLNKDLHLYDKVQGKVVTLKEKMDALKNSADALFDSINGGKFADKGAFENAVRELQQKSSEMNKIANNQAYQNVNNKGESYDGTLFKNKNLKLIPVEEVKKAIKKKYENDYEFLDDIDYDPVKGTAKATVKNNGNIEKMTISLTSLESAAGKTEVAIHKLNVVQGEYLSTGAKWKNAIKGKIASLIQYVSGLSLVMGAYNKFREGFAFVREFDASLTTINQTMDISTSQLQKLGSSSINVGKQLGSTAQDVLGAVSIYANANETADSILEKSKPTVMLSNASGGDVSEASDQIQAVTQQFDELEGQERRIVNSYEKISSNVAMDFKKGIGVIAEGTQNAGSVAKESGMQFEQFASSVAKVAEKTRQDGM